MRHRGYWQNKDTCIKEARKYNSLAEFNKGNASCYAACRPKSWWPEVRKMLWPDARKPSDYWTKGKCREAALKFNTRSEFVFGSPSAYAKSWRQGWLDELCSHMYPAICDGFRFVYAILFPEFNEVYIGISNNPKARLKDHLNESSNIHVRDRIKEEQIYEFKILTDKFKTFLGPKMENNFMDKYASNGWMLLNIAKAGSLGNKLKWTKKKCFDEAKKYNRPSDFERNASGAYNSARINGWYDKWRDHLWPNAFKRHGHWAIKANCKEEAEKHDTLTSFAKTAGRAYEVSRMNGWIDEWAPELWPNRTPKGYWQNKENCLNEAKKYKCSTEFRKGNVTAYCVSQENRWLAEIHLLAWGRPIKGHWNNKEFCMEVANNCQSFTEFYKNTGPYKSALRNNWLEEFKQYWNHNKQTA